MDVVREIGSVETGAQDNPVEDVRLESVTIHD
jgi:peptidyl-prolyl cis-trans isomerase A (cyclophilin A)